jgi:hypothetical protein
MMRLPAATSLAERSSASMFGGGWLAMYLRTEARLTIVFAPTFRASTSSSATNL